MRSLFDTTGFGLEIGPSYSPIVPKAQGFNVQTLDHASRESLQAKYRDMVGDAVENIEEVDFVADGRPMPAIIGSEACYDYIVASHVIEHMPDLIAFLRDCAALLKADGKLVLAVPDKRFCFDVLRPLSSIGQVVQAHIERRTRHVPGTILDNFIMLSERTKNIVWSATDKGELELRYSLKEALTAFRAISESLASSPSTYHDAHAWTFTPSSFRYVIEVLAESNYISLKESDFSAPGGFEFFVTLSKAGVGPRVGLVELLRRSADELKSILI